MPEEDELRYGDVSTMETLIELHGVRPFAELMRQAYTLGRLRGKMEGLDAAIAGLKKKVPNA